MKHCETMAPWVLHGPGTGSVGGVLCGMTLVVSMLTGCPGPQLMPTPNVYLHTSSNPFAAVAPSLRTNTVDVLYATDRIDARVSAGFLGHSYFYGHPAVSADLILLLRDNLEPGSPGRPLHKRDVNFWQITEEYPALPPGIPR